MTYIENPKTKGSGIICGIPQKGTCPVKCKDCFFQSGRSYLEPLTDTLPNMPSLDDAKGRVVRINDGNDSNNQRELVMQSTKCYEHAFYNTSMPQDLAGYDRPVVLTVNPGNMTDIRAHLIDECPKNLMFVRFRVNPWNVELCDKVVQHYSSREIPIVLTFMAYYVSDIPEEHKSKYDYKQRTLNSYFVLVPNEHDAILDRYKSNKWVYSCGKDANTFQCSRCGTCLREYFATIEKIRNV